MTIGSHIIQAPTITTVILSSASQNHSVSPYPSQPGKRGRAPIPIKIPHKPHQHWAEGDNSFPLHAGYAPLNAAQYTFTLFTTKPGSRSVRYLSQIPFWRFCQSATIQPVSRHRLFPLPRLVYALMFLVQMSFATPFWIKWSTPSYSGLQYDTMCHDYCNSMRYHNNSLGESFLFNNKQSSSETVRGTGHLPL